MYSQNIAFIAKKFFEMANYKINGPSFVVSCSEKVKIPLMVCSHERSGTHFMMNSISECTEYTVNPFLNFDYMPLGSFVNFFSKESMNKFLFSLQEIRKNEYSTHCVNSIIKSHYPLSLLDHNKNLCRVIYIYRNPDEVFISYWKFLHRWNWLEGPKLSSPLELIKTNPKGQSQRYQTENYTNYFARWASHIIDAKNASRNSSNIVLVNYSELKNNFEKTIEYICHTLKINMFQQPIKPNKEKFIYGKAMEICDKEKILMKNFIKEEIKKFPNLPNDLLNLF